MSVLGLAASLGLTTFVFQTVLGYDDLTYYVPFGAAVLLVALGSDYNVFVAGRIWEEARWLRVREAIAVATPAAAKAVTVAGVALAASFALLAVVPLRSFREFAFVMATGVLLDTFVVRSLLVPALTSLFGEVAWWPGRRMEPVSAAAIIERVGDRTGLRDDEAQALIEGTLSALGDRITTRERGVLAKELPFPVDGCCEERFGVEEFLARARSARAAATSATAEMREYASAVLRTLAEASPDDLAYVRAQLSEDYDPLFGTPRSRFQRGEYDAARELLPSLRDSWTGGPLDIGGGLTEDRRSGPHRDTARRVPDRLAAGPAAVHPSQLTALGRCRDRVLLDDTAALASARGVPVDQLPGFEAGGPRRKLYFDPSKTRVGIVTCGGLCPGLNNVIRGLVMELTRHYGVNRISGFRNGYQGFIARYKHPVVDLDAELVRNINEDGGTLLGSSRGQQDPEEIVDCLEQIGINILFVIGGDGSLHGARQIARVIAERGRKIAIVGIPKTIDNDIPYIDHSFGFRTAFSRATESIRAAHIEARSAPGGIGLVKLMGRHSGFIACYAALAKNDADVVLIPEVPFELDVLLEHVRGLVLKQGYAVIVVAEGAGQEHVRGEGTDRLRQPAPGRHPGVPGGAHHRGFRRARPGGQPQAARPVLRDPLDSRQPLRQRLLRAARARRGPRGHGRADRGGRRPLARAVRAHPDRRRDQPALDRRPQRGPVALRARVDGSAVAVLTAAHGG